MQSPERKWIARVRAGVVENKIEATFLQETGVRFEFFEYESRDRATILGPDLDDCRYQDGLLGMGDEGILLP